MPILRLAQANRVHLLTGRVFSDPRAMHQKIQTKSVMLTQNAYSKGSDPFEYAFVVFGWKLWLHGGGKFDILFGVAFREMGDGLR